MRAKILIVGDDPVLTETRAELLSDWRPSASHSAHAPELIQSIAPDLLIVCQTVPDEKAKKLVESARAANPKALVLAVCLYNEKRDFDAKRFEVQLDNPGAFGIAVAELLQGHSTSLRPSQPKRYGEASQYRCCASDMCSSASIMK